MWTFTTVGWIALAMIWLIVVLFVFNWVRRIWQDSLTRCPETGAIALIRTAPRADDASALEVRHCALWEDQHGCAQGCLTRRAETLAGHRVSLQSLRPYGQQ